MGTHFDPLGFTKQTEMLLRGVKAQDLITEFKRRNISADALHRLTKEDFVRLGANEDHAEEIVSTLCISKKKKNIKPKPYQKISENIEILKLGEKQFNVIQAFIIYCRFRLRTERINSFVEPNKGLSASHILCVASDAILKEINEAELKLNELTAVITMPTNEQPRKYFHVLYYIPIGGLCIATCMLLNRFWR